MADGHAAVAPSSFDGQDLPWRRAGVTLAALIVFWIGLKIPAPGLSTDGIGSVSALGSATQALERLSIFALGLNPLLSALILLEVLKLAAPDWMSSFRRKGATSTEIGPRTICSTLALAALQGYGVAGALEAASASSNELVHEPGAAFRATYVVTAVAATAFLIWLADQITRYGIGSGVWILLFASSLGSLLQTPAMMGELLETGQIIVPMAITFVASVIVSVALLVGVSRAVQAAVPHARNHALAQTLLWPPIIAMTIYGYLSAAAGLVQGAPDVATSGPFFFQYGSTSGLILLVLLIVFFTRTMSPAPSRLALAAAAATSFLTLLTEFWLRFGFPDWLDFWLIPAVLALVAAFPPKLAGFFPDQSSSE